MTELFDFEPCAKCEETFAASQLKKYKGKKYCKACLKKVKPAPAKKSSKTRKTSTSGQLATAIKDEVMPALHAINTTLTTFTGQPIKLTVGPLKVELLAAPGSLVKPGVVPSHAAPPATRAPPPEAITRHPRDLPGVLLNIMGLKKKKWRPKQLLTEVILRYPDLSCSEDTIKDELERLVAGSRVVKLPTRYVSKAYFNVLDEIAFVDIVILKILHDLQGSSSKPGLGPTSMHKKMLADGIKKISLPTLLNHLRVLKTPGWDLIEKSGEALRDGYVITGDGASLLAEIQDMIKQGENIDRNWTYHFKKWKIREDNMELTRKGRYVASS